jgi:hypothetical protein
MYFSTLLKLLTRASFCVDGYYQLVEYASSINDWAGRPKVVEPSEVRSDGVELPGPFQRSSAESIILCQGPGGKGTVTEAESFPK